MSVLKLAISVMNKTTRNVKFISVLLIFTGLQTALAAPSDHFVTTWKTDNPGTSNTTSITVPMVGGPYDVDWDNDGTFDEFGLTGTITHDYGVAGTNTIRIKGSFDSIKFSGGVDKQKIISLDQWGTQRWKTMQGAFSGTTNLLFPAIDTPDFSAVTDMSSMFSRAVNANPNTSNWNTQAVKSMQGMFDGASSANPDTSNWNTAEVTDMSWMFSAASSANPDTSNWNISSVKNMMAMFQSASVANPDTSNWNTVAVTNMSWMFTHARSANPDTSNWNTAAVWGVRYMFLNAVSANPDVTGWNTTSIGNMDYMFSNAISFDQDIGSWDVSALVSAVNMFDNVTLSMQNYESLLIGWSMQTLRFSTDFSGGDSIYCSAAAVAAKTSMVSTNNWTITDGGHACPPATPVAAPDLTPASDTGVSDTDNVTSDNTPSFFVNCTAVNNAITLYTDNPTLNTATGIHVCTAVGIATAGVTAPLSDGAHNISYTDKLLSAESAHSQSLSITIVNTLPQPEADFVSTWKTDNPGSSASTAVTVPMVGGPYNVDWDNDGNFDEYGVFGSVTHDFGVAGSKTIRIRGGFDAIRMPFIGDAEKLISVDQWGSQSWTSMVFAFWGATSLTILATDLPDFSMVTNMAAMFAGAVLVNPDTSNWDTSSVENMAYMFSGAMSAIPDTSNWNTSRVVTMDSMFHSAVLANPDTSNWDTAAVRSMFSMFSNATSANPDTINWNTESVVLMSYMFRGASSANPDVSGWNTTAVTHMIQMFKGAISFDQDIGGWNVTALELASNMFADATLSTANYESLLIGWEAQLLNAGVTFGGGNSTYCSPQAAAARAQLITANSWVITDGGKKCLPEGACNLIMVAGVTEEYDATYEACELLSIDPAYTVAAGANIVLASGWAVDIQPGFTVEKGATLNIKTCGLSLCEVNPSPMPYGCHSCVDQICDVDPSCCGVEFSQACLDKVGSVCGLICD